ncbi:unnamed protein product [Triticum turgidum subsp. durum]|uniref:Glycosyltransferase n=1 Tax=Triticum turgidum subsp. durum TaxID=4567 RepID=A0A9R0VIG2_TRITD|nr:unnamed protein product [Triticum turgidum subsp. durum]
MTSANSGDGQSSSTRAHFTLVQLLAQGHTIPRIDMACLLAEHGAQVSFITTPVNASRLAGFAANVKAMFLVIQLVELQFPAAEFGLPDVCENLDMIHTMDLLSKFLKAIGALQEPLIAHLREQQHSPPSCIISDMINWWRSDIARELGIPRLAIIDFCGFSSLVRHITFQTNVFDHVKDENELVMITAFPTPLELKKAKSPGGVSIPGADQIHGMILEETLRCDGEVIKNFQELEALYIESFE